MNSIIALIIIFIVFFFIYKGWEKEALLILLGTSYIIYPIFSKILILDIYFLLLMLKNILTIRIKKRDLFYFNILVIVAFIPSFLYLDTFDAIFQPLRLIEIILILFFLIRTEKSKEFKYRRAIVWFLVISNLTLNVCQIFGFLYEVKAIPSYTSGGFFLNSGQLGPFFLLFYFGMEYIHKEKKKVFSTILYILIFIIILTSSSRTSLLIFLILFSYKRFKRNIFVTCIFGVFMFVLFPYLEQFSPKNFKIITSILRGDFDLSRVNTMDLRIRNWNVIFNYYLENCSLIFGCGYGLIESNSSVLKTSWGVFTFDNAFLRLIVEGGLISLIVKTFLYGSLIFSFSKKIFVPLLLLSITQETIEDPIVFVFSLLLLIYNLKNEVRYT